ncbi:MAG: MerR family transcriptional regulator [Microthrixaceae bacterium]|nr:MerR family transcriptional regulator [Microthrixaceae bacterium]
MSTSPQQDRSGKLGSGAPETASGSDPSGVTEEQLGFSGRRTAEIVGITYRQLDYWARTGLVTPSLAEARGSGSRRQYSYRDLLELKVIKTLLDAGLKLESVRQVFTYMRDNLGSDISASNLVISGNRSVLVRSDGELVDVLRNGQGVLNVLSLSGVVEEVDAKIVELNPGSERAIGASLSDSRSKASGI